MIYLKQLETNIVVVTLDEKATIDDPTYTLVLNYEMENITKMFKVTDISPSKSRYNRFDIELVDNLSENLDDMKPNLAEKYNGFWNYTFYQNDTDSTLAEISDIVLESGRVWVDGENETIKTYSGFFTVLAENDSPINVEVVVKNVGTQYTEEDGKTEFTNLLNGTYNYTINRESYESIIGSFTINDDDAIINVQFDAAESHTAFFTVLDEYNNPAENVEVEIEGFESKLTNEEGMTSFADLPNDTYIYNVILGTDSTISNSFEINGEDVYFEVSFYKEEEEEK